MFANPLHFRTDNYVVAMALAVGVGLGAKAFLCSSFMLYIKTSRTPETAIEEELSSCISKISMKHD